MATETTRHQFETTGPQTVVNAWKAIGDAARANLRSLADEARRVPPHLKAINAVAGEVRASAAAMTSQLGLAGAALAGVAASGGTLGAVALALGAVAGATALGTKQAVAYAAALKDQADQAQVGVERLQVLRLQYAQIGVSQEQATGALIKFATNLGKARDGEGELVAALKDTDRALLEQLRHARTMEDAYDLLTDKIARTASGQDQARLAVAAFGREGAKLVPVLREGTDGLTAVGDAAREAGAIIDKDLIDAADRVDDRMAVLALTAKAQLGTALLGLVPVAEKVIVGFSGILTKLGGLIQQSSYLRSLATDANVLRAEGEAVAAGTDLERAQAALRIAEDRAARAPSEAATAAVEQATKRYEEATERFANAVRARQRAVEASAKIPEPPPPPKPLEPNEPRGGGGGNAALRERERLLKAIADANAKATVAELDATREIEAARDEALAAYQRQVQGQQGAGLRAAAFAVQLERETQAKILAVKEAALRAEADAAVAEFAKQAASQQDAAALVAERRAAEERVLGQKLVDLRADATEKITAAERRAFEEQQREADRAGRVLVEPFLEAARAIQSEMANTLVGVFDGTVNDAGDAADAILGIFKRLAAELASIAIGRLLIGPTLTSLGLGTFATQAGLAPASGGATFTQSLGALASIFGGNTQPISALLTTGQVGATAYTRSQSGTSTGALDVLGYVGTLNQAANQLGYGVSFTGPQGVGAYFNGQPILTLGSLFGGAGAALPSAVGAGTVLLPSGAVTTAGTVAGLGTAGLPTASTFLAGQGVLQAGYALNAAGQVVPLAAAEAGAASATSGAASTTAAVSSAAWVLAALAGAYLYGTSTYEFQNADVDTRRGHLAPRGSISFASPGYEELSYLTERGGIGATLLKVIDPAIFHLVEMFAGFFGADPFNLEPNADDFARLFADSLEQQFNRIARTRDAFQFEAGYLRDPYSGLGPRARESLGRIRNDSTITFLADVIARGQARGAQRAPGVGGLRDLPRDDLRGIGFDQLLNGLARLDARGRDAAEVVANLLEKMVGFNQALRLTNRAFLENSSTVLRAGESLEVFIARAGDVVSAYGRFTPPGVVGADAARRVIEGQGYLSRGRYLYEAGLVSRERAETSGETILDPQLLGRRRVARRLRGRGKRRRERRAAVDTAQAAGLEGLRLVRDQLAALSDPARAVVARFGDIQASLDQINTLGIKNLDQLPDFVRQTQEAIAAWGDALLGLVEQVREADRAVEQHALTYGEEVDGLRRATDTHTRYNDVLDAAEERLYTLQATGASVTAQLQAYDRVLALTRAQYQAQLTDLQEGYALRTEERQERLDTIGPLGQLADGLTQQVRGLQIAVRGETPAIQLAALTREIRGERRAIRDETDPLERAEAVARLQQLVQQQLDLAAGLYGAGSPTLQGLQRQALGFLRPLEREAARNDEEARQLAREQREDEKQLAKDLRAVQREAAEAIETYAAGITPLLEQQADQFRTALEGLLGDKLPEGVDLETILADPIAAQTLIGNLQLSELEKLNAGVQDLVDLAQGRNNDPTVNQPGRNLAIRAGVGPDGGVVAAYGREGGELGDAQLTGALEPNVWTQIEDNLWLLYDATRQVIEPWLGRNPPGDAGGRGQAGRAGRVVPVYPQAEGGDYVVDRPTLFLAGEAGRERATFTPLRRAEPAAPTVQVTIAPGAIVIQMPPGATPQQARLLGRAAYDEFSARLLEEADHGVLASKFSALRRVA